MSDLREAIAALRYLADHDRRQGGQDRFNAEHLLQIADELTALSAQPQPEAVEAVGWTSSASLDGIKRNPREAWGIWGAPNGVINIPLFTGGEAQADSEARWCEDEEFEEREKACKARCKQYGYTCGKGGEEDYDEGECDECVYDAKDTLRKKYAPQTPPLASDTERMRRALEELSQCDGSRGTLAALSGAADASNASAEARRLASIFRSDKCDIAILDGHEELGRFPDSEREFIANALSPAGADDGKESEGGEQPLEGESATLRQGSLPSGESDHAVTYGSSVAGYPTPAEQREAIARAADSITAEVMRRRDQIILESDIEKRRPMMLSTADYVRDAILALSTRAGG